MRLGAAAAAVLAGALCLGAGAGDWRAPDAQPVPKDNPTTAAKVELGRRLFYEADLSIDGTMACATCHEQRHGFSDGNRTHPGVHGDPGKRNVMGLANVALFGSLTWGDPQQVGLERQVFVPLMGDDPIEMGMAGQDEAITRRLSGDPCYPRQFLAAFPEDKGEISSYTVAKAISAFERTLISFDAPYDRYRRGDASAISDQARRGEARFAALGCAGCHAGAAFTDATGGDIRASFHDLKLGGPDKGLGQVTDEAADMGRFRTASLRNVALTAPYFHDGSAPTLADAIRRHPGAAGLGDADLAELTAFLGALTDQAFVTDKRFSLPPPCKG
jgi:cytochrome c peroxidase